MHWSCLLYQPPNHLLQSIHVLVLPAIPTTQLLTTVYTCAGLVCYTNHPTTYYSLYMCWSCLLYQPPNFLLQSTHVLVLPAIPTTQLLTTVYTCAGLACYTNHPTSYYSLHMCWSCLLYQPPNFLLQSIHVLVLPAIPTTQLLTTVYTCAGLVCYTNHNTGRYPQMP
jgi:Mg/Co/Ni transporter MgtE